MEEIKIQNAREYYNRGILIKYGMIPFGKVVEEAKAKMYRAKDHDLRRIKRQGIRWIRQGVN